MTGLVKTLDQEVFVLRMVLNCSPKLVNATGQEIFNLPGAERRILSNGKGEIVLVTLEVLFANAGSGLSLVTVAVSTIDPGVLGTTLSVTTTPIPLVMLPRVPVIGLLLVESVPRVVTADFRITEEGKVLVKRTLAATNGPVVVTVIV